jgi:hypothetical protein
MTPLSDNPYVRKAVSALVIAQVSIEEAWKDNTDHDECMILEGILDDFTRIGRRLMDDESD